MTAPFTQAHITARGGDTSGIGWVEICGHNVGLHAAPGHFAMVVRPQEPKGHLGRPYAYFRILGPNRICLLTRERPGQATSLLRAALGTPVALRGPLGRPFKLPTGALWAVAGGVGAAAFGPLLTPPHLQLGLKLLVGLRDHTERPLLAALEAAWPEGSGPMPLQVSSDDGSVGRSGSVVELLQDALRTARAAGGAMPEAVLACGPEGMLYKVAQVAASFGVPCQVSVGISLPCGVGTCGACTHSGRAGRTLLACVDGPTYEASQLFDV